jgi:very-short-patch-repair endonuclease
MTKVYNKNELKPRRQVLRNNLTKAESRLWLYLRNKNFKSLKFRRQFSFGYYIADFYCREKKLVIELDGDSHFTDDAKEYDRQRTNYLESLGLQVIRFTNNEVFENVNGVLEVIAKVCETPPDLPL